MQHFEADSASALVESHCNGVTAVLDYEHPDDTVATSSSSPIIIQTLENIPREPTAIIDIISVSDDDATVGSSNECKSQQLYDKSENSQIPPKTMSTYFLRVTTTTSPSSKSENIPTELDEDHEDLMSKLDVYKALPDESGFSCELCSLKEMKTIMERKPLIVRHLLRAHTYCHNYECPCCTNTYKMDNWLQNHMKMVHHDVDCSKFFECLKCEHRCKDEYLLRLHMLRRHAAMYRYVCKCCAKCFKSWIAKNEHEKLQEKNKYSQYKVKGDPKYVCDKCSKILNTKTELIKHLKRIHSDDFYKNGGKVLLNCKLCSKLFMSRRSLRGHTALHEKSKSMPTTSERAGMEVGEVAEATGGDQVGFACDKCGKRLSSKDHLKKHARVHTGERPYPCLECGQAFALLTTMRIHTLSHYGIKPYRCPLCDLAYSQRSALMTHWKSKHPGLPPPAPIEIHQYFDDEGKVRAPF